MAEDYTDNVLEARPLYEIVKETIFEKLNDCAYWLAKINIHKVKKRPFRNQPQFTTSLLDLYLLIRPKIKNARRSGEKTSKYDKLKELDEYLTNPEELKLSDSIKYLILIRELIEKLGITRTEVKKTKKEYLGVIGMGDAI